MLMHLTSLYPCIFTVAAFVSCRVGAQQNFTQNTVGTNNSATGWDSFVVGMNSRATGNLAVAMGFNVSAGSNSSVALGLSTRTISDPRVPGGSSGGAAFAVGKETKAIGDFSQVRKDKEGPKLVDTRNRQAVSYQV